MKGINYYLEGCSPQIFTSLEHHELYPLKYYLLKKNL